VNENINHNMDIPSWAPPREQTQRVRSLPVWIHGTASAEGSTHLQSIECARYFLNLRSKSNGGHTTDPCVPIGRPTPSARLAGSASSATLGGAFLLSSKLGRNESWEGVHVQVEVGKTWSNPDKRGPSAQILRHERTRPLWNKIDSPLK
jgi:hypothetical protein